MVKQLNPVEESFLKGLLYGLSFRKAQKAFEEKFNRKLSSDTICRVQHLSKKRK